MAAAGGAWAWPVLGLARRELAAHLGAPLAWLVLAIWALLTNGWFCWTLLLLGNGSSEAPLYQSSLVLGTILLGFLAPAFTMGSFAGERQQGTLQLLLTLPITETQLVLGKFVGLVAVMMTLVVCSLFQPLALAFISAVDLPQLVCGYLGMVLVLGLLAALGLWISLLVDTPLAAYVITAGGLLVLLLLWLIAQTHPDAAWGRAAGQASLLARSGGFFAGEVRLGDLTYFLAATGGLLYLTISTLQARRVHG